MTIIEFYAPYASFRNMYTLNNIYETHEIAPPSTCYGFLLSLVGEYNKLKHEGVRLSTGLFSKPAVNTVLQFVRRLKEKDYNNKSNSIPTWTQFLTDYHGVIFIDSSDEQGGQSLEDRVQRAISDPNSTGRKFPLVIGDNTSIVDDVRVIEWEEGKRANVFLTRPRGTLTLTSWVDYKSNLNNVDVLGCLEEINGPPSREEMAIIRRKR